MFLKATLPLALTAVVLASPAYAFKMPSLPSADASASASATVAVPDEAAQEALVKRFVSAHTQSVSAQISFAKALGLSDQVQLLEAEQIAMSSGSVVDTDKLSKSIGQSEKVQKAIADSQAAAPVLTAEAREQYATGLVSLVSSALESIKLSSEASSFASGIKGAGALQAVKLGAKLKSGMWVAKETPGYAKGLFDTTKQALAFAKSNKVKIPANADSLAF